MENEKELREAIEKVQEFREKEHKKNQRRIRNGLRSIFIVPAVFLFLLFISDFTGTSKLVMLVLWIASLFLIAAYLIVIEYVDFKIVNMLNDENGEDGGEEE